MTTELFISNINDSYISFFFFQAAFIVCGLGFIIFLKSIFKKLMNKVIENFS